MTGADRPSPLRPLTPREWDVAFGIVRGLSYKEIAAELGIADSTVSVYVRHLAEIIPDPPEYPPRSRILILAGHQQWLERYKDRLTKRTA